MSDNDQKTCAHEPCTCVVPHGQKYCSTACEEAGSSEVEIACQCEHQACSVSV
jgi:hypothetical protein